MFQYSSDYSSKVKHVQFSVLDTKTIRKMSVKEIITHETYNNNIPVSGGLCDLHLGAIKPNRCSTCHLDYDKCPGHFGHIELVKPVYHIGFIDMTYHVLKSVCFNCSELLINENMMKKILNIQILSKRIRKVVDLSKNIRICDNCKSRKPKYSKTPMGFLVEFVDNSEYLSNNKKRVLTAYEVFHIFYKINHYQATVLGFNTKFTRPESLIITVLPIPPLALRPNIQVDSGTRSLNEVTHKLSDIIRTNNIIRNELEVGKSQLMIDNLVELLQYHIATLMKNNIKGEVVARLNSGELFKSISERFTTKNGRIRGNIIGKRVDYSARTVIGGDPTLSIEEVGVPISMAMILTVPERVQNYNIEELQQLVKNGPNELNGANYVFQNNKSINLLHKTATLQIGDVVERHLKNNDIVIFNRQPTLNYVGDERKY